MHPIVTSPHRPHHDDLAFSALPDAPVVPDRSRTARRPVWRRRSWSLPRRATARATTPCVDC